MSSSSLTTRTAVLPYAGRHGAAILALGSVEEDMRGIAELVAAGTRGKRG